MQERGAGESSLVAALCWLKYKREEEEETNLLSPVWLFGIPWTVAHQAPLSMGAPGARILVGHHFLLQGIFSTQWFKMGVLAFQAVSLPPEPPRMSRSHFWWGSESAQIQNYLTNFWKKPEKQHLLIWILLSIKICWFDG